MNIFQNSLSCVNDSTQEGGFHAICDDLQSVCGHSQAYCHIFQLGLSNDGRGHVGDAMTVQGHGLLSYNLGDISVTGSSIPSIYLPGIQLQHDTSPRWKTLCQHMMNKMWYADQIQEHLCWLFAHKIHQVHFEQSPNPQLQQTSMIRFPAVWGSISDFALTEPLHFAKSSGSPQDPNLGC
jgi:hypothetical protein